MKTLTEPIRLLVGAPLRAMRPLPAMLRLRAMRRGKSPASGLLPCVAPPSFSPFLLLSVFLLLVPAAHAQWQTISYKLKGGWNSIYLHGDATWGPIETVLPALNTAASPAQITSVWRWNPNPTQIQFTSSAYTPAPGTPEWSTWTRGGTANTLTALIGQTAYLIECPGTATDSYTIAITQKLLPPRSTWVRNGANFLGFPSFDAGVSPATAYPTMTAYFSSFTTATASISVPGVEIFKYVGGPLGAANPARIYATASEQLDRTQAYWFEAAVTANFYAPLEITASNADGLIYGRTGSLITVLLRNRTGAAINLTVAPVNSASAPTGQDQVNGPVPLTYRTLNASTGAYDYTTVTTGIGVVVPAKGSLEMSFTVNRAGVTGATNALYASLLRFTDGGKLMDAYLPVSARVTSLAGLWHGDAIVSGVSNLMLARYHTCLVKRTVGTVVTEIKTRATPSGTAVLTPERLPAGTGGTLTYQWYKVDSSTNVEVQVSSAAGGTGSTLTLSAAEVLESDAFGGNTTPKAFPLRIILHSDNSGTVRLLSQVFQGTLAASPYPIGICTKESRLKADAKSSAQLLVAAHLPPETAISGTGSLVLGQTVTHTATLAYNAPTNPYVHTYHPDHDNRNARFDGSVAAGVESPAITRVFSFTFTTTAPDSTSAIGWGSSVIGGTYSETVTGLQRKPITATGTFLLRRVSEDGNITLN